MYIYVNCIFLSSGYILQVTRCCAGCGLMLPCKTMKKIKDSNCAPRFYCKHCTKVTHNGQYIILSNFSLNNFIAHIYFNYFYVLAATKIKTILWHLQKDLASFRWWELGEIVFLTN